MSFKDIFFDKESFRKDIKYKRVIELEISMDVCCQQIGISKPTLARLEQGSVPDLFTFFKVLNWLEKDSKEYIKINTKL